MGSREIIEFRIGDILRLRKPHPCGGMEWVVYRLGADIGVMCTTCQRRLLVPRSQLEKKLKSFVARGGDLGEADSSERHGEI
ncbi:protein of unknown function DUF951 [Dehalogenimonas lykanthroporepellens BL-DC-9]|jgi:hypothetical protein|nr:protein of unknown function DUF951 [Dehalogenimonas lykanthroporepellens BL-DC-9]